MTVPITLNNLANLQNETTAVNTINGNNTSIAAAFSTSLYTSGDQMHGNLDMNGYQILNQGATSYTVSTLPVSPTLGRIAVITDGTAGLSWGNTVTGGSSVKYLVWYNGAAWTVLGK